MTNRRSFLGWLTGAVSAPALAVTASAGTNIEKTDLTDIRVVRAGGKWFINTPAMRRDGFADFAEFTLPDAAIEAEKRRELEGTING